jgi:hypothetical protein
MARLGGLHQMLNPVKNLVVARRMFADVGWQPWHRSRYLTASTAMHPHPHARVVPYRGRHRPKFRPHVSSQGRPPARPPAEIPLPGLRASTASPGSPTGSRTAPAMPNASGPRQRDGAVHGRHERRRRARPVNQHGWKDPATGKFVPGIDQAAKALERRDRGSATKRLKALRSSSPGGDRRQSARPGDPRAAQDRAAGRGRAKRNAGPDRTGSSTRSAASTATAT